MRNIVALILAVVIWFSAWEQAVAANGQVLGIHILNLYELDQASQLLKTEQTKDSWQYVTVPLSLSDLTKHDEWQSFFDQARDKKLIPVVRLVTKFENGAWQVPRRIDITRQVSFLSQLNWPTSEKHIIILNETNHAQEFGGKLSPEEYAQVLVFASAWAKHAGQNYVVMPAAMDLAATNTGTTLEAFAFLERMIAYDPTVFDLVDVWNSHSYPNPGFSASPTRTEKNSLRGFQHELAFIKQKTGRDLGVIITETGWVATSATTRWLDEYYLYALQHVWSDPRVKGVTPFLLQGAPGPFAGFSFLDQSGQPTSQYLAYQKLLQSND